MNEEQSINRQEPMYIDLTLPLMGTAVQHTGLTTTLSNGNSIIASSGDGTLHADIRRIVAEEIEKALLPILERMKAKEHIIWLDNAR